MVLWKVAVFPLLSAKICLKIRRTPYDFGYNSWTLWWISKRTTGLTSPCIGLKKMFNNRVSISQTKGSDACVVRPLLKRRVDDFHFSPAVFEPPLLSPLNRYPRHLFLPELQNCSAFQKGLTRPCRSSGSLFVFYCVQFRKVSRNVFFEPLMSCTRNF